MIQCENDSTLHCSCEGGERGQELKCAGRFQNLESKEMDFLLELPGRSTALPILWF